MTKQKITTAIRRKIQNSDQTTVYSVNKQEMLDLVKSIMLDKLTEQEKRTLSKPFSMFRSCSIERDGEFSYTTWVNQSSIFAHSKVLLFTPHDVYELSIPWLCSSGYINGIKQLLQ